MTDEKRKFMRERVNLRCFYLRLWKKLWVLPLAAAAGALCGFLLYTAVTKVTQPALYEATSKIYVHYTEKANIEMLYNAYNSLTWKDLSETEAVRRHLNDTAVRAEAEKAFREAHPEADVTALLPEAEAPLLDPRERQEDSYDVSVYSDIRILHVTGISTDREQAVYRSMLYTAAIRRYALDDEVIRDTELLGYGEAQPRSYPQRKLIAAITGAIIFALLALLGLWIAFLFDNAVYVPEDAGTRYGLPVLGVLPRKEAGAETYPLQFQQELMLHIRELQAVGKNWLILRAQDTDVTNAEGSVSEILRKFAGEALGSDVIISEKTTAKVNTADVVLLEVRSGARLGTRYAHLAAEAEAGGNPVKGIILTGADNDFLQKYYQF
ncbi:MAG: hypothetical protein IJP92_00480 [Lachnospiraceae bacterium]|nr:hypothetical protein [Lachnospiraceae bacterium]